ncbi:MAG TPA: DUF2332 family protein [Solirubrobacterales bacterium]|nr:DUF2332 family protein [Solirubrobacterales bacterium]
MKGGFDREAATALAERLQFQSRACADLGSPLYADLLSRAAADCASGGPTWELLRGHESDSFGSMLALRLMGAVHRLAVCGKLPELAAFYADPARDPATTWSAFLAALDSHHEQLRPLLDLPVQTNEVGRCAALLPGFLAVAAATGLPLRLLELGASAGLNLGWDRYRYESDGFAWGAPDAPLSISFELRGPPPSKAPVEVAERRGCDAAPVDPAAEEGRLTLLSYLWADQPQRAARTEAAIEVARGLPVAVDRAPAAEWLEARLAESTPALATVVFHSIVIQYLPERERERLDDLLRGAGARASVEAPLAHLAMEPAGERAGLWLTLWPGGEKRVLGLAGYHGDPVVLS